MITICWRILVDFEDFHLSFTGVHARGQVCSFTCRWPSDHVKYLQKAIQMRLPRSVSVRSLEKTVNNFLPKSCVGKRYCYYIRLPPPCSPTVSRSPFTSRYAWSLPTTGVWSPSEMLPDRLNLTAMRIAAEHLIGEHNFSRFGVAERNAAPFRSPIKRLYGISIEEITYRSPVKICDDMVLESDLEHPFIPCANQNSTPRYLVVSMIGDAFLWRMCRRIVGTLVQVFKP